MKTRVKGKNALIGLLTLIAMSSSAALAKTDPNSPAPKDFKTAMNNALALDISKPFRCDKKEEKEWHLYETYSVVDYHAPKGTIKVEITYRRGGSLKTEIRSLVCKSEKNWACEFVSEVEDCN
jgi:hypothetical protein